MTRDWCYEMSTAAAPPTCTIAPIWDQVEPHWDGPTPPVACYCKQLKADLLPGTFVLLAPDSSAVGAAESTNTIQCLIQHTGTVARIIDVDST